MNKLAELRKHLAGLKAKGLKLVEKADSEGRDFTEAEADEYAQIEEDIEKAQADIKREEDMRERRRAMEGARAPYGHNDVREDDPAVTGGFKDIGEFAVAVHGAVTAGRVGGTIDSRLVAATPDGTHIGGSSDGEGYLLPAQMRDGIWGLVEGFDEFGPLIDEEPTAKREVKMLADETTPWGSAGIVAHWRAEGSKMDPSKIPGQERNVPLHELYTLALATEELLEDAPRLSNRLGRKAAQAIAFRKNEAIVQGTGVGQPLGWTKSKALIVVAKESGQEASSLLAKNIVKMFSRLTRIPGDKPFWLINQDVLPELMFMTIGDKPVWTPPNGLTDAPGGFLLGLPIRFSEFAETLGAQGDVQLISPKGYYGARRSTGIKAATSIHLYFDYNIQAFRWVFRYGGQPHLSKPISPNKGTATRSHFVTLGARA
ncbi:MAG: phage major capsid protein [Shimia thalassica]|uniref:phage major capsid protein n=1 Tax=Shimia thalassica TaxID=1715693 RepID=UPI003296C862